MLYALLICFNLYEYVPCRGRAALLKPPVSPTGFYGRRLGVETEEYEKGQRKESLQEAAKHQVA